MAVSEPAGDKGDFIAFVNYLDIADIWMDGRKNRSRFGRFRKAHTMVGESFGETWDKLFADHKTEHGWTRTLLNRSPIAPHFSDVVVTVQSCLLGNELYQLAQI